MPETVIELTGIHKSFRQRIVFRDFSLRIARGEMVALQGVSGSGKTTLLNIIGLIEPIDGGNHIIVGHRNIRPGSRAAQQVIRREISYLFQDFALVENLSVEKNLLMALYYVKATLREKRQLITAALGQSNLKGYSHAKIFELSGGEQQRVALARSILKPGCLLLADEPTGSLDGRSRDMVLDIIQHMNKQGRTIVIVTHDSTVAARCSRIVELPSYGEPMRDTGDVYGLRKARHPRHSTTAR
jgi:putative ABC transport system ATP-binding protein